MIIFHKLVKLSQLSIDVLKRYFQLIESMSIITLIIDNNSLKNALNNQHIICNDTVVCLGNIYECHFVINNFHKCFLNIPLQLEAFLKFQCLFEYKWSYFKSFV